MDSFEQKWQHAESEVAKLKDYRRPDTKELCRYFYKHGLRRAAEIVHKKSKMNSRLRGSDSGRSRKPGAGVMDKDEALSRLYSAVMEYVKAHGGRAAVAFGVEIQPEDNNFFRVTVRVVGQTPDSDAP